ncbi:VWA domain-containing protein [Tenacibaculum sp. SZ-18]|uniref:VWA domain-containing protein n=1 Tax=Tenacibaculum sp. SZ-18 TaxID=754423 RepID=UPI001E5C890D|nr:VWA domain-containing protein [Tenacibaculum sp. SZ-18]
MSTEVLIYIILSLLIGVAIAYFQYFFKVQKTGKQTILLFVLRALSVFFLLLLLINPQLKIEEIENIKPKLSVLIDNSLSTSFFKEEAKTSQLITQLKGARDLNGKFDIDYYAFGKDIQRVDSLTFSDSHTNIFNAVKSINSLEKEAIGAMVLVSDGNQTIGEDYEYVNSKQAVYPVVIGDTIKYEDVKISQLNVNKYSYIDNKFPVEALLYYDGNKSINTEYSIYKGGQKIFSKPVKLSKENNSLTITANLNSNKEGVHFYTARIEKLTNEPNTRNNYKSFSVEVIDEQVKVLILTSIVHPDLGAIKKAIESNKQRSVDIENITSFKGNFDDYQFVIVYQPTIYFKPFFNQRKSNYLIITGTKTDWSFLNSLELGFEKLFINQSEDYGASYNTNYLTFIQEDIGFIDFPPLKDKFGNITAKDHQSLLFQKLQGFVTDESIFSTFEKGEQKFGVLFGEGIWKWRASSYLREKSFEDFDAFVGNVVQYLSSNKKRKRLDIKVENLYLANQLIDISALYLDNNFKFDSRASIQISITNKTTKEQKVFPFSLMNNSYRVQMEGLIPGDYSYRVTVEGQTVQKSGTFKVADFQIEEQFTNANSKKLQSLANTSKGKLFYSHQQGNLIDELVQNKDYYTTQKLTEKEEGIIQWQWLLFLIVGLLSMEWFLRKYYGKI